MMRIVECEQLYALFDVDVDAGRLIWRSPPLSHIQLAGQVAGIPKRSRGKEYWVVKVNGFAERRSRLIFLAAHGRLPYPCVDHVNGNSLDDRGCNLREATVSQNAQNHKTRARRIQLPMGVRLVAKSGRFQARIGFEGRQYHLGAFDTPELASAAYQAKRKELFREFA